MVRLQLQYVFAQPVIPPQRLRSGLCCCNEVLDDSRRYVVPVERRFQRALELPRLCDEPVTLQYAVVNGGVGVRVCCERLVKRMECGRPIGLVTIGLQQRVVLPVGQRGLRPVVQRNNRVLDVGVRQH